MLDLHVDIGRRSRITHFDLPRARAAGVAMQAFALFVEPEIYRGEAAWRRTRDLLAVLEWTFETYPLSIGLARTVAEVRAHHAAGRVAALITLEGAHGLGASSGPRVLARLRHLIRRGLRSLGLTWNNSNALAGAAMDGGGGLTALGRQVVRECARAGVLIDVSHASDRTVRDVLSVVDTPVIASHSNARALCDVSRNLPDNLLRAIGRRGGVICVNFYPGFLDAKVLVEIERRAKRGADRVRVLRQKYENHPSLGAAPERRLFSQMLRGLCPVPLARLVDQIEHIVHVAGAHAVGTGSDFDGIPVTPKGLESVGDYPRLCRALEHRFAPRIVRGILGENLLRVLEETER